MLMGCRLHFNQAAGRVGMLFDRRFGTFVIVKNLIVEFLPFLNLFICEYVFG